MKALGIYSLGSFIIFPFHDHYLIFRLDIKGKNNPKKKSVKTVWPSPTFFKAAGCVIRVFASRHSAFRRDQSSRMIRASMA
jgi:hypothetical protein